MTFHGDYSLAGRSEMTQLMADKWSPMVWKLTGRIIAFSEFDEEFEIGHQIDAATHYDAYDAQLRSPSNGLKSIGLRVFTLKYVDAKVRRHRLRCIKRLRKRLLLEFATEGTVLVFYQPDGSIDDDPHEEESTQSPVSSPPSKQAIVYGSQQVQEKTSEAVDGGVAMTTPESMKHRREAARVRQRDLRRAKRRAKSHSTKSEIGDPGPSFHEFDNSKALQKARQERVAQRAVLMYLAYDNPDFLKFNALIAWAITEFEVVNTADFLYGLNKRRFGPVTLEDAALRPSTARWKEERFLEDQEDDIFPLTHRELFAGINQNLQKCLDLFRSERLRATAQSAIPRQEEAYIRRRVKAYAREELPRVQQEAERGWATLHVAAAMAKTKKMGEAEFQVTNKLLKVGLLVWLLGFLPICLRSVFRLIQPPQFLLACCVIWLGWVNSRPRLGSEFEIDE